MEARNILFSWPQRIVEVDMELIAIALIFGIVSAAIAHSKGRSEAGWFLIGLLFNLIGLVAAYAFPPAVKAGVTKKCPKCGEIIKAEATMWRYCTSVLEPAGEAEVS